MSLKKLKQEKFEGFLLINKPQGLTSHDVVFRVRKIFEKHKVGHAGTLDPLATGVLLLGIGSATKKLRHFLLQDKKYRAQMQLGITTDTQDISGKILTQKTVPEISLKTVQTVFKEFLGDIKQIPPMFSAKKIRGKKLYQLARKGISIKRDPVKVKIHKLDIRSFDGKNIAFDLSCSKGTYVRTLCQDVGERLKTGGCLSHLIRLKIGNFQLKESFSIEKISQMNTNELKKILIPSEIISNAFC